MTAVSGWPDSPLSPPVPRLRIVRELTPFVLSHHSRHLAPRFRIEAVAGRCGGSAEATARRLRRTLGEDPMALLVLSECSDEPTPGSAQRGRRGGCARPSGQVGRDRDLDVEIIDGAPGPTRDGSVLDAHLPLRQPEELPSVRPRPTLAKRRGEIGPASSFDVVIDRLGPSLHGFRPCRIRQRGLHKPRLDRFVCRARGMPLVEREQREAHIGDGEGITNGDRSYRFDREMRGGRCIHDPAARTMSSSRLDDRQ